MRSTKDCGIWHPPTSSQRSLRGNSFNSTLSQSLKCNLWRAGVLGSEVTSCWQCLISSVVREESWLGRSLLSLGQLIMESSRREEKTPPSLSPSNKNQSYHSRMSVKLNTSREMKDLIAKEPFPKNSASTCEMAQKPWTKSNLRTGRCPSGGKEKQYLQFNSQA